MRSVENMPVDPNKIFFGGYRVVTPIPMTVNPINSKVGDSFYIHGASESLKIRSSENGQPLIKATLKPGLTKGGLEASVYSTNVVCTIDGIEYPMLAKIFKLTGEMTKAKMILLCSKSCSKEGISWPEAWLTKKQGDSVCAGILIPQVPDNIDLKGYCLKSKASHKERLRIAKDLLANFVYLDERNIQPVDFNDGNFILTKKDKKVWFIDTDSYQVENFPCLVAAPRRYYEHPRRIIQGFCDYSSDLRLHRELAYSIAVLLFEVLFADEPYLFSGDDLEISEGIINGRFKFSNLQIISQKSRELWTQADPKLRNLFTNIFHASGSLFYKKKDISIADLKVIFGVNI